MSKFLLKSNEESIKPSAPLMLDRINAKTYQGFYLSHENSWIMSSLLQPYEMNFMINLMRELNLNYDRIIDDFGCTRVADNFSNLKSSIPIKVRNKSFYKTLWNIYSQLAFYINPELNLDQPYTYDEMKELITPRVESLVNEIHTELGLLEFDADDLLREDYNRLVTSTNSITIDLIDERAMEILIKSKKSNNKVKKLNKTFKRRLFKSIDLIKNSLQKSDFEAVIKGNDFKISSKNAKFDYLINSGGNKNIIRNTKNISTKSITYTLQIHEKNSDFTEDSRLANICIYFDNTPILDQILSIYWFIQHGKEDEVLTTGNFFKITNKGRQILYENKYIRSQTNSEAMEDLANAINNHVDSHRHILANKNYIREIFEDEFNRKINNPELLNFISGLDVSWDEAVDYNAFEHHRIEVFQSYTRRIAS